MLRSRFTFVDTRNQAEPVPVISAVFRADRHALRTTIYAFDPSILRQITK